MYYYCLKSSVDLFFSVISIVLLLPLLLLISILIKLDSPGPVLFVQDRVGKDFKLIKVYKFRTMRNKSNKRGLLITLKQDPRITRLGHFLRRFKIDELPQLFNVLKGEMSLVGPRPEIPKTVDHFSNREKALLSIKPGLTSLASIKFIEEEKFLPKSSRNLYKTYYESLLPKKLEYDLKYLKEQSLWLDMKIIFLTVVAIFMIAFHK